MSWHIFYISWSCELNLFHFLTVEFHALFHCIPSLIQSVRSGQVRSGQSVSQSFIHSYPIWWKIGWKNEDTHKVKWKNGKVQIIHSFMYNLVENRIQNEDIREIKWKQIKTCKRKKDMHSFHSFLLSFTHSFMSFILVLSFIHIHSFICLQLRSSLLRKEIPICYSLFFPRNLAYE